MAKKNENKGQFAPKSKHPTVAEFEKTAHLVGAVLTSTFWFAVVWACAVGLGYLIHLTDEHCTYVSDWMIHSGHAVEAMLYIADSVLLVASVLKHLFIHLKGEWTAMRTGTVEH